MIARNCTECGRPGKITDAQLMKEYVLETQIFHLEFKIKTLEIHIKYLEKSATAQLRAAVVAA